MMYDLGGSLIAAQRAARKEALAAGLDHTIREIETATHIVVLKLDRARGYFYGNLTECESWAKDIPMCQVIRFENEHKRAHVMHARKAWRS